MWKDKPKAEYMPAERVRHPPQPGLLRRVHVDLLRDLLRLDLLVLARDEHVALRLARLLRDLLRLDLLVLAGDEHVARRLARLLPPVLLDPLQGVDSIEKL